LLAHRPADAPCDGPQQLVSALVPELVVDRLEAIEVQLGSVAMAF
jgi:hypothetical protein